MNRLMMYEKIETPKMSIIPHTTRSKSLLGFRSPSPTVESEVIEKYNEIIALLTLS